MTRVAARGAARFADPNSLETRARPVVPVSGSGSNTINAGGVGRVGCAIRLGLHPAARTTAIVTRTAGGPAVHMRGIRCGVRLRLDADGDGRTPDANDRGRRFEADGVGSELRHAARHVRRHTANEV